ncbi:protein mono-ADP-ribosyltransferase PARP15-like isoform X2 [Saccopteryx bilineata]|uniref:protein mono-ADP-ribosyltransferase PARP15-like isoform X2 n=1 Tax=Saccopteryx bilineata TaxID=59482 RepID=UPI00338EA4F5
MFHISMSAAFLDKFTRESGGSPKKDRVLMAGGAQGILGTATDAKITAYEMKVGAITFQVAVGDITDENTDVIVNSTTRTFNLKLGVSKAILEGAGPDVEDECAILAAQPHGDFIVTQGGYLMCKIIIHVLGENDVKKTVSSVLKECERRKHTSVSFPAIGTGNAGKDPLKVADDIISATVHFAWKHSTSSIKKVKVVVLQTELLNIFYNNMKERQITTSPTFQPIFSTEPLDVTSNNLKKRQITTSPAFQPIFSTEPLDVTSNNLKKRRKTTSPAFQPIFPKNAFPGINRPLTILYESCTRTMKHNVLSTDSSSERQNHAWKAGIANEQEEEKRENIPENWTDMNQQLSCVIQLQPGESEYDNVKNKFFQICFSYTIEKIERIQNTFLWQNYQVKKKQMDIKNGHTDNERILFHGTDADSVPNINQHGFNRSYAGKNGIAYGKGTYFSTDACQSAYDQYSRPDSNGRKYIYVVRVLTGDYTRGHGGLITPPSKNPDNSTDLFDSVTNDIQNPQLFVIFSDNQAYPEYLITLRC